MSGTPPWQLRVFAVSVRKQEKWSRICGALERRGLPRGNCLDVGCGVGTLSVLLRKRGGTWTFLEPEEGAAREAEALLGSSVLRSTLEAQRYPTGSFDLITAFDVIEHLRDVPGFLREVARVLVPGGLFVATTPAAGAGGYLWRRIGERFFGITKEAHGHVVEGFSSQEIAALLARAGLAAVEVTPFSRFFTEAIELAYNGAYRLRNVSRQGTRGYNLALSPASGADAARNAWAFPLLRAASPLLRAVARLDRLLPLGPGYEYGIVAEKREQLVGRVSDAAPFSR